jgi:hypothetical protein
MSTISRNSSSALYVSAGIWASAVIVMTAIHHVYGAIVFDTPYRLHIVFIAVPIGIVIVAGLLVAYLRPYTSLGRTALWIAALLILGFCVVAIGIYEGGYNHLIANIVYLAFGQEAFVAMYDTAMHQMPNDVFFELTGIGQFVVALVAAWATLKLWWAVR